VDPGAGQGYARAIYSSKGGLLLVANLLPQLPDRKCYQLWILRKGNPAILSAGLVQLQSAGKGLLYAPPSESLNQLTALAITDEPEGGSVSARGHKLLFGAAETR
jgi:anti-sigma-K factor RskA